MVNERTQTTTRDMGNDNHNSQDSRLQEAVQAGHIVVTVAVPDTDVGLIIGKAGSTIKGIQDRSGANIQIPQSGDAGNPNIRTVSITHPHVEGANLAKQLIEDILGSKRDQAPQITIQVEIPDKGEFWLRSNGNKLKNGLAYFVTNRLVSQMLECALVDLGVLFVKCRTSRVPRFRFPPSRLRANKLALPRSTVLLMGAIVSSK